MAKTTSDLLADRLIAWGVDTIFGFPGDGIDGFFNALRTHQDRLKFVQVRHEESAAFAASGYAKTTGRLGVCVATSGPGGIHMLNGLYDAAMDSQPVLAITGETLHDMIGTHYQQDVALNKLYDDVAVYSERVMGPNHVVNAVDEAIRRALSFRGVGHISIPKDIQTWTTDEEPRSADNVPGHSGDHWSALQPLPPLPEIQRAADVLNRAQRVVILAGQGAKRARVELEQVADILGGVIVKPLLGKEVVPDDSPFTTGGNGLLGTRPSYEAIKSCDAILIVGSTFPYETFYPDPKTVPGVQIDILASRLGLRFPAQVGLAGDSTAVLRAMIPLLQRKTDRGFLETAQKGVADWWRLMEERGTRTDLPMKPQVVSWELGKLLPDDTIVCADTGTVTTWIARQWKLRGNQKFIASGLLATMACGLPYAVGAAFGNPGRPIVAFCGDGGLTMLICELATIVKYKLPVKVVVIKNNVLGEIKWEQVVLGGDPQFGVELQPIDFAKVAEGFGLAGFNLERPQEARNVLQQFMAHPGPALVQCVTDPNEPPMPPHLDLEYAKNFAEAVLHGQHQPLNIAKHIVKDYAEQVV